MANYLYFIEIVIEIQTCSLTKMDFEMPLAKYRPFCSGISVSLDWRHNERDCVSNHRRLDWLINRLFRRKSKKTSKLSITGLCEGNPWLSGGFPSQRASNAENVSIWWRHHGIHLMAKGYKEETYLCGHYVRWRPIKPARLSLIWDCFTVLFARHLANFNCFYLGRGTDYSVIDMFEF